MAARGLNVKAIFAGLLLSGCVGGEATRPAALSEPLGPAVVIDATDQARIVATYTVVDPVHALAFRRVPDDQRAERWRSTDPGFRIVHDASASSDRIVRGDGAAFTEVRIEVPAAYATFPKDYAAFMPYRDEGLLIHSGRFQTCADACGAEGQPDPAEAFPMTVLYSEDEHVIVEGRLITGGEAAWTDRRDGTMVYVGQARPMETSAVVGVIDPALPPAFRAQLDDLFPRLMAYYAERLGALDERPMLFVSLDRDAAADDDPPSSSFSSQGGTLPGQVFMHLAGDGWLEDPPGWDAETVSFLPWFFAHEAGHLYQRSEFSEPSPADTWIHEGGADAFAAITLRDLGVEEAYVTTRLPADARRCEEGLRRGPLSTAGERGDFDLYYQCGLTIQMLADREVRAASGGRATLFDVWADFLRRTEDGAPWSTETFSDVLSSHGATQARAMAERMMSGEASPSVE